MTAVRNQLRSRWSWLLEREILRPTVALGGALAALVTLALLHTLPLVARLGLLVLVLGLLSFGVYSIVDRMSRAVRHAERINRVGLALSNEKRADILRAGLRTAIEFADASAAEASIVTRNIKGDLVVEGTSVRRTLPYLPTVDLVPVLGPHWEETEPGTSIEQPRAALARLLGLRHQEGSVLLLPMHAQGTLLGLLAVGFDGMLEREHRDALVTLATLLGSALAREQLQAKLVHAKAEAQFQSLVQNASDLIIVARTDLSIAYHSPSVERILGYPSERLMHRSVQSLAAPEHAGALVEALERAAEQASSVPVLLRSEWLDASGMRRRMKINITNRLAVPEVRGLVLNVTDVTDQVEVSEALERSQETLRQVNKLDAVGRLAGGIAHDFNNILGAIMMTAGALRDEQAAPSNDDTIDEIEHAAMRGARLTRQLLTFSRSDAPAPEITDVNEIVGGFQRMLRRLIDERVVLHDRLSARLPPVRVDRGMLEQALMNLVVNARDALTDQRGTITIESTQCHLDLPMPSASGGKIPPGHYVVLSVTDDGVGIAAVDLPRIFEPFFTTKAVDKGTGLGLSMVYGIVRQSEGYLEVRSRPDHGTTVSIYLPARHGVSGPLRQARLAAAPHGRGRLLVVEDDDALRRAAVRVLQKHGYEVHAAANGVEAEQIFDEWEHLFDLVVTDVVMPERSGPDMVARLRHKRPGLPVLYISGYAEGLGELGSADALLRKPFRPGELAIRIHTMLPTVDETGQQPAV